MSRDLAGQTSPAARSGVAGLLLWIVIQAAVLLVALADIPLTASGSGLTRDLAPRLMLIAQIIFAFLTFPDLLGSLRSFAVVCAVAFPFTQFAARLGHDSLAHASLQFAAVVLLLGALTLWQKTITSPSRRLIVAGLGALYVLGIPLLWYLNAEFHPDLKVQNQLTLISPVLLAANDDHASLIALCLLHVIVAGAVVGTVRLRQYAARH